MTVQVQLLSTAPKKEKATRLLFFWCGTSRRRSTAPYARSASWHEERSDEVPHPLYPFGRRVLWCDSETRQELRVEARAGASGLRTNCLDTESISRKLNSTVCCSPGRAAKGATPVVRPHFIFVTKVGTSRRQSRRRSTAPYARSASRHEERSDDVPHPPASPSHFLVRHARARFLFVILSTSRAQSAK